jgi:hypothetical protein
MVRGIITNANADYSCYSNEQNSISPEPGKFAAHYDVCCHHDCRDVDSILASRTIAWFRSSARVFLAVAWHDTVIVHGAYAVSQDVAYQEALDLSIKEVRTQIRTSATE